MESKTLADGRSGNYFLLLLIIICSSLLSCSTDFEDAPIAGQAFIVSVSSDGNYAITSHAGRKVILWDIQHKTKKIISKHANIYSAYFIKNTHYFIWQDLKNIVHVQNVNGKEVMSFSNFPTYGQVMTSDLKQYFAVNENLDLYGGYGKDQHLILSNGDQGGFIGEGKLLNLTLSTDNQLLLTSGDGVDFQPDADFQPFKFNNDDGVILWDVNKKQPTRKFIGNIAKTIATLSPDGNYVVSGDEDGWSFTWDATNGKLITKNNSSYGGYLCKTIPDTEQCKNENGQTFIWDNGKLVMTLDNNIVGSNLCKTLPKTKPQCKTDYTGYPPIPDEFFRYSNNPNVRAELIFSLKFIDLNGHYLRFIKLDPDIRVSPYTFLYQVNHPKPLKYLRLDKYPWPFTIDPDDFSTDQNIDTAPAANILVVAQANGPGIIVYKFHPKNFTLQKIWAPDANNWHLLKMGIIGILIIILFAMIFQSRQSFLKELFIIFGLILMILLAFSYFHRWDIAVYFLGMILGIIFMHFPPFVKMSKKNLYLR